MIGRMKMTRNNSDNDLNHDLGKDFALGSLALNIKRTIKNKYLEACKMEKEKQVKKLIMSQVCSWLFSPI